MANPKIRMSDFFNQVVQLTIEVQEQENKRRAQAVHDLDIANQLVEHAKKGYAKFSCNTFPKELRDNIADYLSQLFLDDTRFYRVYNTDFKVDWSHAMPREDQHFARQLRDLSKAAIDKQYNDYIASKVEDFQQDVMERAKLGETFLTYPKGEIRVNDRRMLIDDDTNRKILDQLFALYPQGFRYFKPGTVSWGRGVAPKE